MKTLSRVDGERLSGRQELPRKPQRGISERLLQRARSEDGGMAPRIDQGRVDR